jgi:hypothetical protein
MRAMNKRQEEAMAKLHRATMAFAKQRAKQAVLSDIRAKGQKIADFSCLQINLLAQDYFAKNMEQLITDAVQAVLTWPGFAKLRASANIASDAQKQKPSISITSAVQMLGAK